MKGIDGSKFDIGLKDFLHSVPRRHRRKVAEFFSKKGKVLRLRLLEELKAYTLIRLMLT